MAKLVLEVNINKPLDQNDVICFNKAKNCWEVRSYKSFNNALYQERNALQREIVVLRGEFENFKTAINGKLKEYHDILQILTK